MNTGDPDETTPTDEFDVAAYADELRQAARRLDQTGPTSWRAVVERGLSEAYRQRDPVGLASMVQVIVGFLDAQGRLEEAVSEIGHALTLAKDDPSAVAMLEALAACYTSFLGDAERALRAVGSSERAQAETPHPIALSMSQTHCAAVRLTLLNPGDLSAVHSLLSMAADQVRDSDSLFLMSVYIPYQFALGKRTDARPWIRGLRLAAESAGHEYRAADAATFEQAEVAVSEPGEMASLEGISPWNWLGRWRAQALRLHSTLLRRNLGAAERELGLLLRARQRAGDARLDEIDGFEALFRAMAAAEPTPPVLAVPRSVGLINIASVLAAVEAIGVSGSQGEAAKWYDWMNQHLPAEIKTSLEWPASRLRLQGLLGLRAGDHRGARHYLELALDWALEAGYPIEHALTQVQLAEYLDLYSGASSERMLRAMRAEGWTTLRAAGVDPAPHAYVVAHSRAITKLHPYQSPLTRREAEVLALLAEGLTYKGIAEKLGIRWPTVQALAHRCYEKLDASGRVRAVQAARELGIL